MKIFDNAEMASWLEDVVSGINPEDMRSMAFVATGDNGSFTAYYHCSPNELFAMSGLLMQDAICHGIEENGKWLKSIIENSEGESDD